MGNEKSMEEDELGDAVSIFVRDKSYCRLRRAAKKAGRTVDEEFNEILRSFQGPDLERIV